MERGFKSRCEEMSRSLRAELGLRPSSPLLPNQLAEYLRVVVWSVTDLGLAPEDVEQLLVADPDSWSAVTVTAGGRDAIIVNPNHRRGRYSSDVMHELSHLLLNHEPSTMFFAAEEALALRGYSKTAEDQANWLAGALLLPRDALVDLCKRDSSPDQVCEDFGVSRQMLDFRMRVTGAARQFSRNRKATLAK